MKYDMPEDSTLCGLFRCCREANHDGACEEDITYLDNEQLDSIRNSNGKK